MKAIFLIAAVALAGSLATAQTSATLPAGWDTKEGIEVGSAPVVQSNFFAGWDILNGSTIYNPSRVVYLYGSRSFPWGNKTMLITKLSVRRDGPFLAVPTTAHTKEVRIIMSTSNQPVHRVDHAFFDGNHGSNRTDVMGSQGKPKIISFQATPVPGPGKTAPFDVSFVLDKPFPVLPNTKTLVIEMRTYRVSVPTGRWRADSVTYPAANFNGGSFNVFYSIHCLSTRTFYTRRSKFPAASFGTIWRTNLGPGKLMIGWIGPRRTTGIPILGTGGPSLPVCELWVDPVAFTTDVTGPDQGGAFLNWGKVPNLAVFVNAQVSHQAVTLNASSNQAGLAITRAMEETIGTGYDPNTTLASQTYSYGDKNNTSYTLPMDPDKEPNPRWFFRRAVIFKIN